MSTKARLELVDVLRGLAVLFMLWMHTADGWLVPRYRHTELWEVVRLFGGMAAPLFMFLAGVSLALTWHRRGGVSVVEELPRAGRLMLLGYALRLQMWVVDGGGIELPSAWLPLVGGYAALYLARRWRLAVGGGVVVALGLWRVAVVAPARLDGLLRVDILQAIGAALALTTLLGAALPRRGRVAALLVGAMGAALLTHAMRQWVPGGLPGAVAGYVAYWRPEAGTMPMALFPLFPWLTYALGGAAVGLGLARQAALGRADRYALGLALVGIGLAWLCDETTPHGHAWLASEPWLSQPIRAAYRFGVSLGYLALAAGVARFLRPLASPLMRLGKASLLVYWVHLQLAFGLLSRPLSHRLEPLPWLGWLALLALAMWSLAALTEGLRRGRRGAHPEASGGGITKARMGLVT